MLDTWNRAERCRDLAEECRRRAAMCSSRENRDRYLRMAEHLSTLAEDRDVKPGPARESA
jgi:hypothetical protein